MVEYQMQSSRGDPVGTTDRMSIYQYPNTDMDDNEVEGGMLDALEHVCDQLYDEGVIGYYEIAVTYDHPELGNDFSSTTGCSTEDYGLIDKFDDYLKPKTPPIGAHLLVTDYISYGCGDLGDGGKTPFNANWRPAVIGTEHPEPFWQNGGIHEVMHTYIDADVISDSLYDTSHEGGDRHHDLGKLYCGWWGDPTSPMCLSYENTHANHGACSDTCMFDQSYDMHLTDCAVEAIDQTADTY